MDIEKGVKEYLEKVGSVDRKDIIEHDFREGISWALAQIKANRLDAEVDVTLAGIFDEIQEMLWNKYQGNKLLKGKTHTAKAFKRAYLDVKKIRKRYESKCTD